jgi:hypothetical protein
MELITTLFLSPPSTPSPNLLQIHSKSPNLQILPNCSMREPPPHRAMYHPYRGTDPAYFVTTVTRRFALQSPMHIHTVTKSTPDPSKYMSELASCVQ